MNDKGLRYFDKIYKLKNCNDSIDCDTFNIIRNIIQYDMPVSNDQYNTIIEFIQSRCLRYNHPVKVVKLNKSKRRIINISNT